MKKLKEAQIEPAYGIAQLCQSELFISIVRNIQGYWAILEQQGTNSEAEMVICSMKPVSFSSWAQSKAVFASHGVMWLSSNQ